MAPPLGLLVRMLAGPSHYVIAEIIEANDKVSIPSKDIMTNHARIRGLMKCKPTKD